MLKYLVAIVATGIVFMLMDLGWISQMLPRLYRPDIGALLADKPSVAPAAAFYLIYMAGVTVLAIAPGLAAGSWAKTAGLAAMMGLVAYSTYDLTNQATLRLWSLRVSLWDMAWGVFATTVAASAGFWAARLVSGVARS